MMLKIDLVTLLIGMMPLFAALFSGAWIIVKMLVFKPLDQMAKDISQMKESWVDYNVRMNILELKVEILEQQPEE